MKKLIGLIIITLMTIPTIALAQQKTAKVTLKNGTSFTGVITELNPASHVTIIIAGFENKINMSDVLSIESMATPDDVRQEVKVITPEIDYGIDYPETVFIKAGPYEIEMVLVKGGIFSMGYDGRGSLRMNTEPIHDVALNSFYINKEPLNKDVVGYLKKGTVKHSKKASPYIPWGWKDANSVVELLANASGFSACLITESQWEYVASRRSDVFGDNKMEINFCYDWYGDYLSTKDGPQLDPSGPLSGRDHVARSYTSDSISVFKREKANDMGGALSLAIRFTIIASEIR